MIVVQIVVPMALALRGQLAKHSVMLVPVAQGVALEIVRTTFVSLSLLVMIILIAVLKTLIAVAIIVLMDLVPQLVRHVQLKVVLVLRTHNVVAIIVAEDFVYKALEGAEEIFQLQV